MDLGAGIQAVEMGYMTVLRLGRLQIPIVEPLLQLAARADLQWGQPLPRPRELAAEIRIAFEDLRGALATVEQIAQNLHIHRRSRTNTDSSRPMGIFGRKGRTGDEPSAPRFFDQGIEEKLGRPLEDGIDLGEIGFSGSIFVVIPKVQA